MQWSRCDKTLAIHLNLLAGQRRFLITSFTVFECFMQIYICCIIWVMKTTDCLQDLDHISYLIKSEVEAQSGHVACFSATADVSQFQLEVVPLTVCHLNLIQAQTHRPGGTTGHWEHQLTIYHLGWRQCEHTQREKKREERRWESTRESLITFKE